MKLKVRNMLVLSLDIFCMFQIENRIKISLESIDPEAKTVTQNCDILIIIPLDFSDNDARNSYEDNYRPWLSDLIND